MNSICIEYMWHSHSCLRLYPLFDSQFEKFRCPGRCRETIASFFLADWEYPVISRGNNWYKSGRDCERCSRCLCPRYSPPFVREIIRYIAGCRAFAGIAIVECRRYCQSVLFIGNRGIIGGNNTSSQLNATAECPGCFDVFVPSLSLLSVFEIFNDRFENVSPSIFSSFDSWLTSEENPILGKNGTSISERSKGKTRRTVGIMSECVSKRDLRVFVQ